MYHDAISEMSQMLTNLSAWLREAEEHAEKCGYDPEVLVTARLRPDMFTLARQVQTASDTAKFAAARLAGREAPRWEDDEATFPELQERIAKTLDYLAGFDEKDFAGADDRRIVMPFNPTHYALGRDYFLQFAQPNFFFHITTAYAILRHQGVALGKRAYIGHVNFVPIEG